MTEKRKLAAVMFTDIAGYTALMSKDEQKALALLQKNRELQQSLAQKHNGEFLKEMGDGTLLCFQSALDAVRCALNIQKSVKDDPDLNLRIGIHLGDIIFRDGDVFGDGVNVASRIEALAESGGIYISGEVYKLISNKPEIKTGYRGEKQLKNVDHPVKIYALAGKGLKYQQPENRIEKDDESKEKSIIVLPFENMSSDPEQEYFSDGLTEEVITDLSYIQELLVISRSSTMTFKGTKKTIPEIVKQVNVRFVLEGSVRKAGNNLRITAQLIDAFTDSHLWAEKYSGTLDDVFDIQEKVSRSIVDALKVKLTPEEHKQIAERPINNVQAYEYYLKASEEILKSTEDAINHALRYLQNAINISGDNAQLYSGMAFAYWSLVNIGVKHEDYLVKAEKYAKKALMLDPDSSLAHVILAYVDWLCGKFLESPPRFKKALEINPNEIFALVGIVSVYQAAGKIAEADPYQERLMQIDPLSFPANWSNGAQYYFDGNFHLGLQAWQKLYELHPENPFSQFIYVLGLAYNNQIEQAIPIIDQIAIVNADTLFSKLGLILKYAMHGEKEKLFQKITPDFQKTVRRDYAFSYHLSSFLSLINQKKEALDWLEIAIENGLINFPFLSEYDPFLKNIREEERFKKLIKRVKKEWENFEV